MAPTKTPPEFIERGIKRLADIEELPRAASTRALARQIQRVGGQDGHSLAAPDEKQAFMLARPLLHPTTMGVQFNAPQLRHLQAGTLGIVYGHVILTRIVPWLLNSRVRPRLAIPRANRTGRVPIPWGPADLGVDPDRHDRLLLRSSGLPELAAGAQETAAHIEVMQKDLADTIGREGIEEPLLLVPMRLALDNGDAPNPLVMAAVDGGSRTTIAQGFLADVIDAMLDHEHTRYTPRRRKGLEELGLHLRGRLPGLLSDDQTAERDVRDELQRLLGEPAKTLIASRLYRGQRTLYAPAIVVVSFEPSGSGTILDAAQQLIGNTHKRGPLQWEASARDIDTRDQVLRSLYDARMISEAELYLLGPRFEEAHLRFAQPASPDYRVGELIRLFHGVGTRADEARRLLKDVLRSGKLSPLQRAGVISAAIDEQLRDASPSHRDTVETALKDLLSHNPLNGRDGTSFPSRDVRVEDLLAESAQELSADVDHIGPARLELAAKGGVALVLLGALDRPYNAQIDERPSAVVTRMLKTQFGHQLLGEAITTLRAGATAFAKLEPTTHEPVGHLANGAEIPMDGENLRALFPTAKAAVTGAAATEEELVQRMRDHLVDVSGALDELEKVPAVGQRGIDPRHVQTIRQALNDLTDRVGYLVGKHREHYGNLERGEAA